MTGDHIAIDHLVSRLLGEAGPDSASVSSHLESCGACSATLARLAATRDLVRADNAPGPSAAAVSHVKQLIANPDLDPRMSWIDSFRRVAAVLSFDSRQAYAQAGLRGTSDSYLMSFATDDMTLDLDVQPPVREAARHWHLTGQLDVPGSLPSEIIAVGGRGHYESAPCDEHGMFSLELMPGSYDLMINRDDSVIVFPEIDVG